MTKAAMLKGRSIGRSSAPAAAAGPVRAALCPASLSRALQPVPSTCRADSRRRHAAPPRAGAGQDPVTQSAESAAGEGADADRGKEKLGAVASALIAQAKVVLHQKIDNYNSQLREIEEDASKNPVYMVVNAWTVRLLQRKVAFCQERLATMEDLEASVMTCSLDGDCSFQLRSSGSGAASDASLETLLETLNQATAGDKEEWQEQLTKTLLENTDLTMDKEARVALPPLPWHGADEARDLEDALWAASLEAGKVPGASVAVSKTYGFVARASKRDAETNVMASIMAGMDAAEFGGDKNATLAEWKKRSEQSLPFDTAVTVLLQAWLSTCAAGFVGWLLDLDDPLRLLQWGHLIPRSVPELRAVLYWTLPLAAAYSGLALARDAFSQRAPAPAPPPGSAAYALESVKANVDAVATRVQSSSRSLAYTLRSTPDDMRILYAISTAGAVAVAAPWMYGLLPQAALRFAGWWNVSLFPGERLQGLLALPMAALITAAVAGFLALAADSAGDATSDDANRDETQYVDDVFDIVASSEAAVVASEPAGSANSDAFLRRSFEAQGLSGAEVGRAVDQARQEPPSVITMDFQSASMRRSLDAQAEWIVPAAVSLSTLYLTLETMLTGHVTAAVISEIVAISCMDAISRPWDRSNMKVHVEVRPHSGSLLSKIKRGAGMFNGNA